MEKIKINMCLDDNDIIIKNESMESYNIRIGNENKIIKAKDIYDLLDFKPGNKYELIYDKDESVESPVRDYWNDVVVLLQDIINEINNMADSDSIDISGGQED